MPRVIRVVFSLFSLTLLFLTFTLFVSAHSFGPSLEQEVGDYFIDVGYESDPIVARESTTFALELYERESRLPVEFNDIWVRIERGEQTAFATGVGAGFSGQPTMIYTFAEAGEHTLFLRFQDEEGGEIVELSFPLNVVEGEGNSLLPLIITGIVVVTAGAVFAFIGLRGISKNRGVKKETSGLNQKT